MTSNMMQGVGYLFQYATIGLVKFLREVTGSLKRLIHNHPTIYYKENTAWGSPLSHQPSRLTCQCEDCDIDTGGFAASRR
jgi:hypothetical protein